MFLHSCKTFSEYPGNVLIVLIVLALRGFANIMDHLEHGQLHTLFSLLNVILLAGTRSPIAIKGLPHCQLLPCQWNKVSDGLPLW